MRVQTYRQMCPQALPLLQTDHCISLFPTNIDKRHVTFYIIVPNIELFPNLNLNQIWFWKNRCSAIVAIFVKTACKGAANSSKEPIQQARVGFLFFKFRYRNWSVSKRSIIQHLGRGLTQSASVPPVNVLYCFWSLFARKCRANNFICQQRSLNFWVGMHFHGKRKQIRRQTQ